jgi:hypothetical protein
MLSVEVVLWLAMTMAAARMPAAPPPTPVDFRRDVQPILEHRCQPCHFPGGKMYAHLPFDKPETIVKLGTKVFTRIKKDDEQAVIRAFLASRGNAAPR